MKKICLLAATAGLLLAQAGTGWAIYVQNFALLPGNAPVIVPSLDFEHLTVTGLNANDGARDVFWGEMGANTGFALGLGAVPGANPPSYAINAGQKLVFSFDEAYDWQYLSLNLVGLNGNDSAGLRLTLVGVSPFETTVDFAGSSTATVDFNAIVPAIYQANLYTELRVESLAGAFGVGGITYGPADTVPPSGVPDGGSTMALLGLALPGLCLFARKFKK